MPNCFGFPCDNLPPAVNDACHDTLGAGITMTDRTGLRLGRICRPGLNADRTGGAGRAGKTGIARDHDHG
jgi:hypothetical protein